MRPFLGWPQAVEPASEPPEVRNRLLAFSSSCVGPRASMVQSKQDRAARHDHHQRGRLRDLTRILRRILLTPFIAIDPGVDDERVEERFRAVLPVSVDVELIPAT